MKTPLLILTVLVAASSIWAEGAASSLHFNAILTAGKEKHFGLSSEQSGAKSSWLTLGDSFEGYQLKSFDDQSQTLTLEHEGKTETLGMDAGRIKTATTKATLTDAQAVIDKMHFEDLINRSIEQQKKMIAKMSAQMAGRAGSARTPEEQAEFAKFQAKLMDTLWAEMKPDQIKADMVAAYSDIFTKEELQGMADFYGTSTGQAMVEKQPEVQQRLAESMMPRMMAAMPKIQQMAQDYKAAHAPATPAAPAPTAATK